MKYAPPPAGKIAPEYTAGCELNVGGGVVSSALCDVCGVSRSQLRDMYAQHGDLGDVAQVNAGVTCADALDLRQIHHLGATSTKELHTSISRKLH